MTDTKINLTEITDYKKDNLKHTDTKVKDSTKSAYLHDKTLKGIEGFKGDKLKHAETVEKNSKPTKEDIEKEKEELAKLEKKSAF